MRPERRNKTKMKTKIYSSRNGNLIGIVENFDDARYENAVTSQEGHCRADDVLDDEDIERLGIAGDMSIYAITA